MLETVCNTSDHYKSSMISVHMNDPTVAALVQITIKMNHAEEHQEVRRTVVPKKSNAVD